MQDSEGTGDTISDDFFFKKFAERPRSRWPVFILVGTLLVIGVFSFFYAFVPPRDFPTQTVFTVKSGSSPRQVGSALAENSLIRSPLLFRMFSRLSGGSRGLKAGDYYFAEPQTVLEIARRLTRSQFKLASVKVTIPEGLRNTEIASLLKKALLLFDKELFVASASRQEGFLFPDTYFFLPNVTPKEVIRIMREAFDKKVTTIRENIDGQTRPPRDIVIMASILEEEARTADSRRTIAGILWKRLDAGMPLQVDAVFPYIFDGKPYNLGNGDLKVESPYNTYLHIGLPPGPISNPGLDSILATVTPIETPYWYYLSDREGNMHYARSHAEHLVNRAKYLGK